MTDSHKREYIEKEIAEIDLQISALKEHKKKHIAKLAASDIFSNSSVVSLINNSIFSILINFHRYNSSNFILKLPNYSRSGISIDFY